MNLQTKIYTKQELIEAATERDGCLAFYNTTAMAWFLILITVMCAVYLLILLDFDGTEGAKGFFIRFISRDPVRNIIGLIVLPWLIYAIGIPCVLNIFKKGTAIGISGNNFVFLDRQIRLEDIKLLERSYVRVGVKIILLLNNGEKFIFKGIILRGFLCDVPGYRKA